MAHESEVIRLVKHESETYSELLDRSLAARGKGSMHSLAATLAQASNLTSVQIYSRLSQWRTDSAKAEGFDLAMAVAVACPELLRAICEAAGGDFVPRVPVADADAQVRAGRAAATALGEGAETVQCFLDVTKDGTVSNRELERLKDQMSQERVANEQMLSHASELNKRGNTA